MEKDTVGISYPRGMCSSELSIGVTHDGGRSLTAVANTIAHELGHLMNMEHDGIIIIRVATILPFWCLFQ